MSRELYANVDFHTGLIYRAMGFPTEYCTVLLAIARTARWLAQREEMLLDKEQKLSGRASSPGLRSIPRAQVT